MATAAAPIGSRAVRLRRGAAMPRIGLGTSPMREDEVEAVVPAAVEAGYRLFDTAENYRNEAAVGRGLRASGIARDALFVTTKFNRRWHRRPGVRAALEASLERMGLDRVDLLMIHWPNPSDGAFVEAFEQLLELYAEGLLRAVGTSNFTPAHLEACAAATGEWPDVNQIQCNPLHARAGARAFHDLHEIVTEAWSPLGASGAPVLGDATVGAVAARVGATPAQTVLAWHLSHGLVAIPKSARPARAAENLASFEVVLSAEDVAELDGLDRGEDGVIDPDRFGH